MGKPGRGGFEHAHAGGLVQGRLDVAMRRGAKRGQLIGRHEAAKRDRIGDAERGRFARKPVVAERILADQIEPHVERSPNDGERAQER